MGGERHWLLYKKRHNTETLLLTAQLKLTHRLMKTNKQQQQQKSMITILLYSTQEKGKCIQPVLHFFL